MWGLYDKIKCRQWSVEVNWNRKRNCFYHAIGYNFFKKTLIRSQTRRATSWSIKVSIAAQKITDCKGSDTTWELRMGGANKFPNKIFVKVPVLFNNCQMLVLSIIGCQAVTMGVNEQEWESNWVHCAYSVGEQIECTVYKPSVDLSNLVHCLWAV